MPILTRFFSIPFLIPFLALAPTFLHSQEDPALMRLGNGIAAVAEGEIITVQELRRQLEPIVPRLRAEARNAGEFSEKLDQLSRDVLQNMVDRIIIVNEAKEKGLLIPQSYIDDEYDKVVAEDFGGDRERFLDYLKTRGITPREFRKDVRERVIVNVMRQQNRRSESEISPERIEAFYVENKIKFYQSEAIHLRQIILQPMADEGLSLLRQTARQIMQELQEGAKFGDLARKYSQDSMNREGGDWGWVERQDIRQELSDIAFNLEPGEYSEPVEIGETVFILYVEDKREEMIQPIRMVRDVIDGEIARETQQRWLEDLREDAYVRFFI